MAELFASIKGNMSSSTDFLKEWAATSKELNDNWNLYSSDSESGVTSKLQDALTEGTASEVLGVINMSALDIRAIKELLPSHFANYATTMNNVSEILNIVRQIAAGVLRTADNTDGLIDKLEGGFKDLKGELTEIKKNTKDNSGR